MSLKERLLQDMKDAMKEKDTVRKNTVQLVRSGILQIEKDKKKLSLTMRVFWMLYQKNLKNAVILCRTL